MENRTPSAAPAARARGWGMWALVAALALVAVGVGWWWMGDSSADAAPQFAGATAAGSGIDETPLPGVARIVDAAPSAMPGAAMSGGMSAGQVVDPAVGSDVPGSALQSMMADAAAGPTPPADPFASVIASAEPAASPAPARPAPPRRSSARQDGSNDLLSTLLHNIQTEKSSAAAEAASLDALVQRLSEDEAPSTRRRSEQIQSNLRDCPAPNTAAGIKCRQEICAVYAGRDPACPALN